MNGGGPRNLNNRNNGNEKEKKHNAPYIPKEFCNKMLPEVRKSRVESSKKFSPDQQSYGSQYGGKGPMNYHQNKKMNENMVGTTQEDNRNNDNNKYNKE